MGDEAQARNLRVDTACQKVEVRDGLGTIEAEFPVSTSQFGLGCVEGSHCTPTGRLEVAERIGEGHETGAVFKGRVWTGEIWTPDRAEESAGADLILTRILWLRGLDPENANTLGRYIYFHGTNHEDKIGTPASHGCIRLRNEDMLCLFEMVAVGTAVEIR
ncbi:MAG: L,D-transpeptidase [Verrucomicrobiae bacterium]|nr:L,D-transpeptidase [Verrucomicrobiae bacterium]